MSSQQSSHGMTDMTQGRPARLIFFFALPLLVGNIFQQLYNMVDSIVVGRYVGTIALAAVGTGFPLIFMLSSLFMGLGIGATVMVAQYYGAQDHEKVRRTVDTIYTALVVGAIPLTVIGLLLTDPLLWLMNVPADTMADARTYVLIVFGGIVGTLGYNVNAGILQGLGDSRTPLLFLAIACVINIVLDLTFVIVFHMGVAGVAIATIIAQIFSWIFGIFYINRKYPMLQIHPFSFRFDRQLFSQLIRLGIPAGIQQALFSLGIMTLQALVNRYGADFIAGFNGANKLDTFAFMPIQSFCTAVTTFVGQNIGAGRMDRVRSGTRSALVMSWGFCLGANLLLLPFGPVFMRMFSTSPAVIDAGMAYLNRVLPFYFLLALFFTLSSVMRGAGEMMIPMISSILSLWLARVPAAYLLDALFGRDNMFFCYVVGWLVGVIVSGVAYFHGGWRNKAVVTQQS